MWLMFILVLITFPGYHIWKYRKENIFLKSFVSDYVQTNDEMKKIISMGLYYRFSGSTNEEELDKERKRISKIYMKNRPHDFEQFVAKIVEEYYGGIATVTVQSGDFGVDIEHQREDGLYLGQVKCYEGDLIYEPIAIIHSQMVKQKAKGGFVVTTSTFKESAREYAKELNIILINGIQLAEMWAKTVEEKKKTFEPVTQPQSN
jgi:restriction system protein